MQTAENSFLNVKLPFSPYMMTLRIKLSPRKDSIPVSCYGSLLLKDIGKLVFKSERT